MEPWREELYHSGRLGQKWGVRNGPPYPLSRSQLSSAERKLGGINDDKTDSVSNHKLKNQAQVKQYALDRGFKLNPDSPNHFSKTVKVKDSNNSNTSVTLELDAYAGVNGNRDLSPKKLDAAIKNAISTFASKDRYSRDRLSKYIDKENITEEWLGEKVSGKEVVKYFDPTAINIRTWGLSGGNIGTTIYYEGGKKWKYNKNSNSKSRSFVVYVDDTPERKANFHDVSSYGRRHIK